ncbi:cation diffusion facilitator family transporter [Sphingomonas paeninsulae]|jgi:cation diffusion facilitator family transporter|uniref:Cation diffusion facilitator family transporter n=1 Tax=Sphingomonas paeninsulae TaxID=2319844 RepID=A0A494TGM3_SPHPE|nr:cation diffusion facilitator family transporter [Sphingomonas paeninsulae]AYJ86093.1 cation diffusion facilitator family transporter [Sphingomonas paeninsulae]
MKPGNNRVLIVALAANVGIAVAKFVAAAVTGSSAMLTEGVHSLVDSTNQLLLLYGQKRSVKAPDARYPGGYGRELYFWSFVVALLVFALGAGVSVYEGILHMLAPEPAVDPLIAYGVLLVAFVLEGGSTVAAFRQFNGSRGGKSWWKALTGTKDATVVIVLLENGAAMAGLIVAAIGLVLSQVTGNPHFDGAASIVIGLLLGMVAIFLAREAKGLLIGEAADPALVTGLREAASRVGIMRVGEVITVHNAPDQIVAAMSVDFDNRISAGDVERIIAEIEADVRKQFPTVTRLYIRPVEIEPVSLRR